MHSSAQNVIQLAFPNYKIRDPLPHPKIVQGHGHILLHLKQLPLHFPGIGAGLEDQIHGRYGRFDLMGPEGKIVQRFLIALLLGGNGGRLGIKELPEQGLILLLQRTTRAGKMLQRIHQIHFPQQL